MRARHVLLPLAAMLFAAGLIGGCGSSSDETTLSLIEHAETDTVRHIGPAKEEDSVGDILAFANPVFNAGNTKKVGSDNGNCVRTAAGRAWECIWTVSLSGGQITVEGPFYDGKDSTLAITGGTGEYAEAGGQMQLHARDPEETEYDFTYEIDG
jgi:allene oxide cyclase